jgi:hypothetical protein
VYGKEIGDNGMVTALDARLDSPVMFQSTTSSRILLLPLSMVGAQAVLALQSASPCSSAAIPLPTLAPFTPGLSLCPACQLVLVPADKEQHQRQPCKQLNLSRKLIKVRAA